MEGKIDGIGGISYTYLLFSSSFSLSYWTFYISDYNVLGDINSFLFFQFKFLTYFGKSSF